MDYPDRGKPFADMAAYAESNKHPHKGHPVYGGDYENYQRERMSVSPGLGGEYSPGKPVNRVQLDTTPSEPEMSAELKANVERLTENANGGVVARSFAGDADAETDNGQSVKRQSGVTSVLVSTLEVPRKDNGSSE